MQIPRLSRQRDVSPRESREAGAIMVELLIVFPVALLAIGAIIDFGMAAHRTERIAEIARQSARLAAIVSFEDDSRPPTQRYGCPVVPRACDSAEGWEETCVNNSDLSCLALTEARNALLAASIDPNDWLVQARICEFAVPRDSAQQIPLTAVQVDISPGPQGTPCWICFGNNLSAAVGSARAMFMLESAC